MPNEHGPPQASFLRNCNIDVNLGIYTMSTLYVMDTTQTIMKPTTQNTTLRTSRRYCGPFAQMLFSLLLVPFLFASAAHAQKDAAIDLVKRTTDELIAGISGDNAAIREDKERLYSFTDGLVAPHFDFERFAKVISGKHWRSMTPEQHQQLQAGVRTRLIRTIATGLSQYSEQTIKLLPQREGGQDDEAIARMEIRQGNGVAIQLGYRLYKDTKGWHIYDVILDGISMATTYRTQLANHVSSKSIDSFIELVKQ